MSLAATYTKAVDGKWYEEARWSGVDKLGRKWFLCLDEDDPPEMVVELGEDTVSSLAAGVILKDRGFKGVITRSNGSSGRLFGSIPSPFIRAASFDVSLEGPVPVPDNFDSVSDSRPLKSGTYFTFSRR